MMRLGTAFLALLVSALSISNPAGAAGREEIRMVGSPLVLEFAQSAAKRFAANTGRPTPSIEITGSGVGFGMFCEGVGFEHPDINASSRRITATELANCRRHGVQDVTEIEIGIEGLAVVGAKRGADFDLSRQQLFRGLAREIEVDGRLVPNPHQTWHDVDPALPASPILVMGPSANSAALHSFLELVMAGPCLEYPAFRALDEAERYTACRSLRRDGAYLEGAKNENAIFDWLQDNASALAVVNVTVLQRHSEAIEAHAIDGIEPTPETLSAGTYPLTHPMYIYVKNRHITEIAGLQDLLYELTAEHTISPEGYLVARGLVPLDDQARNHARDMAISLQPVSVGAQ